MIAAKLLPPLLLCMLTLHAPDGSELLVQSENISVIRPIAGAHREQVAAGTGSVLYLGGRPIGIKETAAQVRALIADCPPK